MPATANNVVPFPDKSNLGLHPLVDAAVFTYRGRGVIPVRPDTKRPYLKEWQLRGTANLQEVMGWWQQWPDALLGIVTGKKSGVWMLDVDFRNGGDKTLAALEAKYGPLPKISAYTTPGGIRYPFKWQPGIYIRTTANQIGDGLDVRGHRADGRGTGQAIVPPSVTSKGVYARTPEWREGNVDYAPLWLLFLVGFPRRERDILAALGIFGPADFGGAPPDQWQPLVLEKIRSTRGPITLRGSRAPGEATQLVPPDQPLTDAEKVRAVAYIAGTVDKLCAEMAAAEPGNQEITLNNAGMRINGLLKGALYLEVDTEQLEADSYQKYCAASIAMVAEKGREPWLPDDAFRKWEHTGADAGPHEILSKIRRDKTEGFEEQPAGGEQKQQSPGAEQKTEPANLLERVSDIDKAAVLTAAANAMVRPWLMRGNSGMVYGDSTAGKTFLALDLAWHLALGRDWHGHRIKKRVPVLYICLEGAQGFRRRMWAAEIRHGDPGDYFSRIVVHVSLAMGQGDGDTEAAKGAETVIRAAKQLEERCGEPVGVIIVDTKRRATAGDDENSTEAAMYFLERRLGHIIRQTGAACLYVHHTNRQGAFAGNASNTGGNDIVIMVERNGDARRAYLEKDKDGAEFPLLSFGLDVVPLGEDEERAPITSCVVAWREPQAEAAAARFEVGIKDVPRRERTFRHVFDALAAAGQGEPSKMPGTSTPAIRVAMATLREGFFAAYVTGEGSEEAAEGTKRSAWSRLLKKLPEAYMAGKEAGIEYVWRIEIPGTA